MKRKQSLRTAYAEKMRAAGKFTSFKPAAKNRPQKRRKPLKKISRAQATRLARYKPIARAFIDECRENGIACLICMAREIEPPRQPTEVHHKFGRNGPLLFDRRGFIPSCRACREWPHDNGKTARTLGLLGEAHEWGVPIDRHKKSPGNGHEKPCQHAQPMHTHAA